jgi:hypothetical protein
MRSCPPEAVECKQIIAKFFKVMKILWEMCFGRQQEIFKVLKFSFPVSQMSWKD